MARRIEINAMNATRAPPIVEIFQRDEQLRRSQPAFAEQFGIESGERDLAHRSCSLCVGQAPASALGQTQFRRAEREEKQGSVPGFLPVRVEGLAAPPAHVAARGPVEVVLGSGVKLHFEHRLDHVGLTALAAAFGGRS